MSSDTLCTGTRTQEAYQDIVLGCDSVLEYLANSSHWTGTYLHKKVSKFVMAAYQGIYVHIKYGYVSQQETYVLLKRFEMKGGLYENFLSNKLQYY